MGLSTVYGIVKQNGGHIWVYSHQDQGTTFKIYFPRINEPLDAFISHYVSADSTGHGETILLVDDNTSVRSAVAAFLDLQGYNILQADSGVTALEMTKNYQGPIHLLISDVVMPEMNGKDLAKHLTTKLPDLRILYMSGYAGEAIHRHSVLDTDTAFLSKPVAMQTLLLKIRELLSGDP